LTNTSLALAADGNKLYVGCIFTNAGSVAMTNIGYWDGAAWHSIGGGLGIAGNNVRSLAVTNGTVYAGGFFTNAAAGITNIARWNGSAWLPLGGGVNSTVYGLALKGTDLYATGPFSQAGGTTVNYVARWDGANWFPLGTGLNALSGNSIAVFGNYVCVAGSFTAAGGNPSTNFAVWNGSSWLNAGFVLTGTGYRVVSTSSNVYVGGNFLAAGPGIVDNLAAWDGNSWSPIGPPGKIAGAQTTVRAFATDNTNLYVGGSFLYAGQTNAQRIGRYDGTNWYTFGAGLNNDVKTIALVGTNIYAAGTFTGSPGGSSAIHFARWNGSVWTNVNNSAFSNISALATHENDLYIAGYFGGYSLVRWDGTNFWNVLQFESNTLSAFYIDGIGFTAMAIQDTNIYVSGHFSITPCDEFFMNCTNCANVIRFDGTYGRIMGSGINSNANAIAVAGSDVYFGGPFTSADGVSVRGIARWDGAAWHDVGGGIVGNGVINALAASEAYLYAGGTFTNIGGVPANHIAKWNGTTWSPLGSGTTLSGTSGTVNSLLALGDDLYVGGSFRTAGNKPSYFIARWNEALDSDIPFLQFSHPITSGSNFQANLTAFNTPTYVIDSSTNLTNWTPWLTNSITPYDLKDTNSQSNPRRFFRAHSLP